MTIRVARPSFTLCRFLAMAIVLAVALAGATALPTAQTGGQPAAQTAAPAAGWRAMGDEPDRPRRVAHDDRVWRENRQAVDQWSSPASR